MNKDCPKPIENINYLYSLIKISFKSSNISSSIFNKN